MDVTCLTDATLEEIAGHDPDLVVLDVWLAAPDQPQGWLLARQARADSRLDGVGIVLMSADAHSLHRWADEARALDIVPLAKPFALADLHGAVEAASDLSHRRVPSSP